MSASKTVLIGDCVCYESAAGTIHGEVIRIVQSKNAAGNMIDWIHVEYHNEKSPTKKSIAVLAETSLETMKFVVTFRDLQYTHEESAAA
jgi:hypothetical protein